MDASAFIQENKRWLIGCAVGSLVWMIASSVIESIYTVTPAGTKGNLTEAYDRNARDTAEQENETLKQELKRLRTELAFVVDDKYTKWTGPADTHLFVSGRDLRQRILNSASDRDCIVEEKGLIWEPVTGIDLIRKALFGLDVCDEIQKRLFAAHDATIAHDEDAMGLAVIDSIKLESQRFGARRGGRGRRGEINIDDLLTEQRVTLQFQADEPTIAKFLELCRKPNRTLVIDRWTVTKPPRPGEPSMVKANLSGIAFIEKKEGN